MNEEKAAMSPGVLAGIRIVELSGGHAAAVAAMLLAEAGADVVKIETEDGERQRRNASFAVWNRSKRSVCLDLEQTNERAEAGRLLAKADVVITDWIPAIQASRRVDPASLRANNSALVHASIGGWPASHPLADAPVDDTLVLAEAGLLDEQPGYRDGPIYLRFPLGSWGAAYLAAIGIVAKLFQGLRTATGGEINTSLLQGALVPTAMLWRRAEHADEAFEQSMGKAMRSPQFECSDGVWLHLKAPPDTAPLMRAALDQLGPERVAELNRGCPSTHNAINWGANAHIFRTRPSSEWLADLWAADIPVQADLPLGQIYFDEQALANGYVVSVEDPVFGRTRQPGSPITMEPPIGPRRSAPTLGSTPTCVWDEVATKPFTGIGLGGPPLDGVKVADFGAYLAGPLAAMLLADLGADVIKIEGLGGDTMRRVPGAFIGCQRGKRSLALDLKQPDARDVAERLFRWADVVHHNIRLPAAERLGLDYGTISAANPKAILSHVSSYGPVGPRKDWPGYDQLFQAQSGWEYEGAGEGNPPMWHRFGMMDHQAAMASVLGTLLALYHRERTGTGQAVAASLLGASLLTVSETIVGPDGKLTPFVRLDGRQLGVGAGRRLYRARDGWVAVVAGEGEALVQLKGKCGVATDAELEGRFEAMDREAIIALVTECGGAAVRANVSHRDAFFDDDANREAALVAEFASTSRGRLEMIGAFLAFDGRPALGRHPPPEIGEHSGEVLVSLGYTDERIERMASAAVAGLGPRVGAEETMTVSMPA